MVFRDAMGTVYVVENVDAFSFAQSTLLLVLPESASDAGRLIWVGDDFIAAEELGPQQVRFVAPESRIYMQAVWASTAEQEAERGITDWFEVLVEEPEVIHPVTLRDVARMARELGLLSWLWKQGEMLAGRPDPRGAEKLMILGFFPNEGLERLWVLQDWILERTGMKAVWSDITPSARSWPVPVNHVGTEQGLRLWRISLPEPTTSGGRKKNQEIGTLIVASAVGGAASTIGALAVERAFRRRQEAKDAQAKEEAEKQKSQTASLDAGERAVEKARRMNRNPTAPPEAEYAVKRWGSLSYTGPQDVDLTWEEFARRIAVTGDPGSEDTAAAIRDLPGMVREYAVIVNNPEQRKLKNRLLR